MVKKKKKSNLVMVASMVPLATVEILRQMAEQDDRTVSKIVRKLVEESPQFQEAKRQQAVA